MDKYIPATSGLSVDLDIIKKIEIFKTANEAELKPIINGARLKNLKPNSIIVSIGEKADYVYFVVKGHLQVYLDNAEGKQIIIRDLHADDCFGELGVLCNADRCANIITKDDTRLLIVNGDAYLQFCRDNINAARLIIDKLASSLTKLTKDYHSLALNNLDHRLVRTLIETSEKEGNKLVVKYTHSQLADRIAATRESVSRAISNLSKKGLVNTKNNEIILNDQLVDLYGQL